MKSAAATWGKRAERGFNVVRLERKANPELGIKADQWVQFELVKDAPKGLMTNSELASDPIDADIMDECVARLVDSKEWTVVLAA